MKKALRILSIACFTVALGLVIYKFMFAKPTTVANNTASSASTTESSAASTSTTVSSVVESSAASESSSTTSSESVAPTPTNASFTVSEGELSPEVADNLVSAGIITDAQAFLEHLESRQLAELIQVGTFELNSGMSLEEIANILTNQ